MPYVVVVSAECYLLFMRLRDKAHRQSWPIIAGAACGWLESEGEGRGEWDEEEDEEEEDGREART